VKAAAYEGLLEKAASEGKKGAGQYFTPRILIQTIVRCMKPDPRAHKEFTICDPAAGTGGFLMCSYEWLMEETEGALTREDAKRLKNRTYYGTELVPRPRRLCLMNLYLHGLEANIYLGDSIYEPDPGKRYDMVLTNPPFGTKGANQAPVRDDFTISTSNKQLNFVQHVMTILKPGGRAAIVLPDGVLSSGKEVFKILMEDCDLHTILRLPLGTFTPYSPGVKANVIFFTKGRKTDNVWIYDARTNIPKVTKKERPLTSDYFADFENCFGNNPFGLSERKEIDRFKCFELLELIDRDYDLDIFWIKDQSIEDEFEDPNIIIESIKESEEVIKSLIEKTNDVLIQDVSNITDWKSDNMEDAAEIIMGQSPPSKTYNINRDGLPFFQGKKDFGQMFPQTRVWCNEPKKIAQLGDTLLSVRAPVGPVNMAKEKCCIGRGLAALRAKEIIDKEYFYFYMKFMEIKLTTKGRGSTFNAIKREDIKKIRVTYPKDIKDQKKMIEMIKALIENCRIMIEKNLDVGNNLLHFQKSVLSKLLQEE
jgi:type I restriction enzyme M protein